MSILHRKHRCTEHWLWLWLFLLSLGGTGFGVVISWGVLKPQFPAEPAPESELSGRLLDSEGHPLAQARVICFCETEPGQGGGLWVKNLEPTIPQTTGNADYRLPKDGVTDATGKFTFKVARTQSWLLVLGQGGSALVHVGAAKADGEWRIRLRPAALVEGTFRLNGGPAAHQGLVFTQSVGLGIAGLVLYYTVSTDEQGRYHIDQVASPHAWRPLHLQVDCVVPASGLERAQPRMMGLGSFSMNGQPQSISLDSVVLHAGEKFHLDLDGMADAQGHATAAPVASGKDELPSTGNVRLKVAGDEASTPGLFLLTDAYFTGGWPPNRGWTIAGHDTWESRKFPKGAWNIQAARVVKGRLWFTDLLSANVEDGKTTEITCGLKPGAALTGHLSDEVPRPVRNGHVLVWVQPSPAKEWAHCIQWEDWTRVNEDGTFLFEGLPPGDAQYVATCDGWISQGAPVERPMQWVHGGPPLMVVARRATLTRKDSEVEVPMQREGQCRVTVVNADGSPAPGVEVRFAPQVLHHGWRNSIQGLEFTPRALASLVQAGPRDNSYRPDKVWPELKATTDAFGVAVVQHIPPVEETVFALKTAQVTQYIGGDVITMGEALPDAQVVCIKPGETAAATVRVPTKEKERK